MTVHNRNIFEGGWDFLPDMINLDVNADLAGDWFKMSNFDRFYLLLIKPAGTAGDDIVISPQQATTNTGTSAKALTFTNLWHKVGTMTSTPTFTAVVLTTASSALDLVSVNSVDLAADTNPAVVICEFMAENLDVSGGFEYVNVTYEGDDISNSLLINSHWMGWGNKYAQNVPVTAQS